LQKVVENWMLLYGLFKSRSLVSHFIGVLVATFPCRQFHVTSSDCLTNCESHAYGMSTV